MLSRVIRSSQSLAHVRCISTTKYWQTEDPKIVHKQISAVTEASFDRFVHPYVNLKNHLRLEGYIWQLNNMKFDADGFESTLKDAWERYCIECERVESCVHSLTGPPHGVELYRAFIHNVTFSHRYTKCDVTNLMTKFNITNADILMALCNGAEPFGMGVVENALARKHNPNVNHLTMKQAETILSSHSYIDYLNGIPIKQTLESKNIVLDMKRYDDRHFEGAMYQRILGMLLNKIK
jgi:hypothetical protein